MLDGHVVLGQFSQPPAQLTFRVFETEQPRQGHMVCPHNKLSAKKVVLTVASEHNNGGSSFQVVQ